MLVWDFWSVQQYHLETWLSLQIHPGLQEWVHDSLHLLHRCVSASGFWKSSKGGIGTWISCTSRCLWKKKISGPMGHFSIHKNCYRHIDASRLFGFPIFKKYIQQKNPQQEAKSWLGVVWTLPFFEEKICASEKKMDHFPQGFLAKIYTP